MVILNVTYNVLENMREAYIEEIKKNHIEKSCLEEPGCLQYSFYLPIDEENKNTVFLLEKYTDEAAFEFHKKQAHFAALQDIKAKYVENTDIKIYKD